MQLAVCVEEAKKYSGGAFDLVVVDLRLPDGNGLDSVEWFKPAPFVVVTGFATTDATVRAMRLGALGVLEKPIDVDTLVPLIEQGYSATDHGAGPALRSAAERVAAFIVAASTAESDPRTLADWARHVGISRSTLNEQLRLAGVKPPRGRDLARALRAVVRANQEQCPPEALIESRDQRTIVLFSQRTGLDRLSPEQMTIRDLLATQQLLPESHEVVQAILRRLPDPQ